MFETLKGVSTTLEWVKMVFPFNLGRSKLAHVMEQSSPSEQVLIFVTEFFYFCICKHEVEHVQSVNAYLAIVHWVKFDPFGTETHDLIPDVG